MCFRFCVCYKHKAFQMMLEAMFLEIRSLHSNDCDCGCNSCVSHYCTTVNDNISSFMKHSLCEAQLLLSGSSVKLYNWDCLALTCNNCYAANPNHILSCPKSNWQSVTGKHMLYQKLLNNIMRYCCCFSLPRHHPVGEIHQGRLYLGEQSFHCYQKQLPNSAA